MNIGIIVYSQTGNTNSVGLKLKEKLSANGHSVNIERILLAGDAQPVAKDIQFESRPEVSTYDALVFGAPVEAFSLSQVMKSYLTQVASLKGKKVACFVTKGLPFYWTGGSRAIVQMKKICGSKDATICGTGIVVWMSKDREKKIDEVVEKLSRLF
jgi:flavodoxin